MTTWPNISVCLAPSQCRSERCSAGQDGCVLECRTLENMAFVNLRVDDDGANWWWNNDYLSDQNGIIDAFGRRYRRDVYPPTRNTYLSNWEWNGICPPARSVCPSPSPSPSATPTPGPGPSPTPTPQPGPTPASCPIWSASTSARTRPDVPGHRRATARRLTTWPGQRASGPTACAQGWRVVSTATPLLRGLFARGSCNGDVPDVCGGASARSLTGTRGSQVGGPTWRGTCRTGPDRGYQIKVDTTQPGRDAFREC